jgi:hypothetical protein
VKEVGGGEGDSHQEVSRSEKEDVAGKTEGHEGKGEVCGRQQKSSKK